MKEYQAAVTIRNWISHQPKPVSLGDAYTIMSWIGVRRSATLKSIIDRLVDEGELSLTPLQWSIRKDAIGLTGPQPKATQHV